MRSLLILPSTCLLPVLVQAAPAAAEARPGPMVPGGQLLQLGLTLAGVIGVILLLAWFMRRVGHWQGAPAGTLKVLAGLSLGARERILLVQVGDRQLVVGVAPGRISTLHLMERNIETPGQARARGFPEVLRALGAREAEK